MNIKGNIKTAVKVSLLATALFLIPLYSLLYFFKDYVNKDEKKLIVQAQEMLRTEMNGFSSDLSPANYITRAFDELKKHIGLENRVDNNSRRKLTKNDNDEPYLGKDYINTCYKFLKENYGFEPCFYIYDKNPQQPLPLPQIGQKYPIINSEADKLRFFYGDNKEFNGFRPEMARFFNAFATTGENKLFIDSFKESISSVSTLPAPNIGAQSFFSGKFGYQMSYHLLNAYPEDFKSWLDIKALTYFIINSTDIDTKKLLENAKSGKLYKNTSRTIVDKNEAQSAPLPVYKHIGDEYCLLEDFQNFLYTQAQYLKIRQDNEAKKLEDILKNKCLKTSIKASFLHSHYRNWVIYINYGIYASYLLIIICFIMILKGYKFKYLKISGKIKMALVLTIAFPLFGLLIIAENIKNSEASIIKIECIRKMQSKMSLLSKAFDELNQRFVIEAQMLKKKYADTFFTDRKLYDKQVNIFDWTSNNYIYETRVIDDNLTISGKQKKVHATDIGKTKYTNEDSIAYYKIYINLCLGYPDSQKPPAKFSDYYKKKDKLLTVIDLFSEYLNQKLTMKKLSSDGYTNDYYMDENEPGSFKASFQLLAHKSKPNHIKTLAIMQYDTRIIMFFKIYDLIKNIKDSFFEFDPNYDISYGIFIRNDTYVNAPIIDKIHGYKELQSLALKTLNGKNSIHNYTDTTIDISKYTTSLPIIIVAHANLHPTSHTSQDYLIIVFSILFYMLLTAILLSDAMSSAFASPIKTLKNFVDDISSGNYFVKTLINTKDEIESLGNSLNEMSSELEKKEKMRRFVSEDLYKQTKKDTDDKASKKM